MSITIHKMQLVPPTVKRNTRVILTLLAASSFLVGCSDGTSTDGPDAIVNNTSTEALKNNASNNIGSSLDTALNGVSRVTSGSSSSDGSVDDPAETGVGGLWNDDAQSLVSTSLDLGNDDNTVRNGARITIDPDDEAVCAEELVDMNANQAELERCRALVSDMLVQIDAQSDTEGTMTYLFRDRPLATVGYTSNSNSFELNLGVLKTLADADLALDPEYNDSSPLDTVEGAIRMSAVATNITSGFEAGSVSLEVSQPIAVISADTDTMLSLGNGKIFSMTADAASENATIEIALGALRASEKESDFVNSIDMKGLTAILDIVSDSDQLTVRNLGIGNGPLTLALDNTEVVNLGLDTFGFTVSDSDEAYTLSGGLNLRLLVRNILDDNTVSDTLFSLLEITAPAGTALSEQFNDSLMVASGGPLNYSLTTQDENGEQIINQVTVSAGQCADDTDDTDELQIVNCQ